MKAKSLETVLANESGMYSEMVTRFQKMRDSNRLPKSRGKNAELLSTEEIVWGILAVVSDRPGFAAVTAIGLYGMLPVGLPEDAFAQAPALGKALAALLEDEELCKSLIEVRLGDSDPRAGNSTTAAIIYRRGDEVVMSQYIGNTAVSLFNKGKEKDFDRRTMGEFSIARETVLAPRLFSRIAREMSDAKKCQKMMENIPQLD
ncbi:hypothetical protein GFK91_31460 (plasmid) [Roseibium aggregatum]|uniref:hypothetical protein n=1 Tax=Roseibium aggregatum TaxID=187304 RepID=UPI001E5807B7|nr:hypothetical protein [Roseibium aggregatum]UES60234.1 hypothetical protein GFK91_31460 [Roseibium aggregatum]